MKPYDPKDITRYVEFSDGRHSGMREYDKGAWVRGHDYDKLCAAYLAAQNGAPFKADFCRIATIDDNGTEGVLFVRESLITIFGTSPSVDHTDLCVSRGNGTAFVVTSTMSVDEVHRVISEARKGKQP